MNEKEKKDLEVRFHQRMVEIYEEALDKCGYRATRFLQMVTDRKGLETARDLICRKEPSEGFTALWEKRRLDLTVEYVALQEPWCQLFTEEELAIATQRLREYGYVDLL